LIFVDANIFYNLIVKTELTVFARSILGRKENLVTSWIPVNEVVYAVFRKIAKERGFPTIYDVKKMPENKRSEMLDVAYDLVGKVLGRYEIEIIPGYDDIDVIHEISRRYSLLPSDATILATMLENGIYKLATLDEDFAKARSIIELLPENYWKEKV